MISDFNHLNIIGNTDTICYINIVNSSSLPNQEYEGDKCLFCKEAFSFFKRRVFCSSCSFSYCGNCLEAKNEGERICDICRALHSPKNRVNDYPGLVLWSNRHKDVDYSKCQCVQCVADMLSSMLKSTKKEKHVLSLNLVYKFQNIFSSLPFGPALLRRFLDHSIMCSCSARSLSLDLFSTFCAYKAHQIQGISISFHSIRPLFTNHDPYFGKCLSRAVLVLSRHHLICPDEPEVIDNMLSKDPARVSFIVGSLAFTSTIPSITTFNDLDTSYLYRHASRLSQLLLSTINTSTSTLSTKYYGSIILLRITNNQQSANQIISYSLDPMFEVMLRYCPTKSTSVSSDHIISVFLAQSFLNLWNHFKDDTTKKHLVFPVVFQAVVTVLDINDSFILGSYLSIIQGIVLQIALLISESTEYCSAMNSEQMQHNIQRLKAERQSDVDSGSQSPEISIEAEVQLLEQDLSSKEIHLQEILDQNTHELSKWTSLIGEEKNKLVSIQNDLNQLQQTLSEKREFLFEIVQSISKKKAQGKETESQIASIEAIIGEEESSLATLRKLNEDLKFRFSQLELDRQLNEYHDKQSVLFSEKEILSQKRDLITSLHSHIEDLKCKIESTKSLRDESEKQIIQYQKDIESLKSDNAHIAISIASLTDRKTQLESKIEKQQDTNKNLNEKKEQNIMKIQSQQITLNENKSELSELSNTIEHNKIILKSLKDELDEYKTKCLVEEDMYRKRFEDELKELEHSLLVKYHQMNDQLGKCCGNR